MHGIHCYLFKQGHCSYIPGKELVIRMGNVKASFQKGPDHIQLVLMKF